MKEIDISILSREPNNTEEVTLIIEPLAPLSMVTDLPGSYYKSQKAPSKKMLCGLIENIIGWRFSGDVRNKIVQSTKLATNTVSEYQQGSTYKPLLMDYFEIISEPIVKFDSVVFFDDIWSRNHSRKDSPRAHAIKCRNITQQLIKEWDKKVEESPGNKAVIGTDYKKLIPNFYPIPTKREYVSLKNGSYNYSIKFDPELLYNLCNSLSFYNIGYLGNNEGWVDVKIKKYDRSSVY